MAQTVAQHSVATFTTPVNGTSPIDATTVRGNDNTLRVGYNDHDADPGVHLQSSLLASRPAAGESGRKWLTTDVAALKVYFDTGSAWSEISYLPLSGGTVAGNVSITGTLAVTGVLTATGGVVGNVTGNADTATKLSSARTFAVTGDVTGSVSSDLTSGASIGTTLGTGVVSNTNVSASAAIAYSKLALSASIVNADISATAAIVDTKLATISTASKVSNSATTATSANTASAIVARDGSGNFTAGTITAALTGNASTATALATARTINGTSFDGTANITVTAAASTLTGSTLASGVTASSLTSVGTLSSVAVSGTTALNGVTYTWPVADGTNTYVLSTNGSGTLSWAAGGGGGTTTNSLTAGTYLTGSPFNGSAAITFAVDATDANTASKVVARDASGNFSAGTVTAALTGNVTGNVTGSSGSTTGNAATATALQTARAINGTNFDGTAAITVTAAAGTLTGASLASGVTGSSLTSVGTLTSLAVTGDLTVDTSTLKVDSTNNRVGVVNASPAYTLDVGGNANVSTGSTYKVNGVDTLSATTLGSAVVTSSLTSVGALNAGSITSGFGAINIGTDIFTGAGTGLTGTASGLTAGGNALLVTNTFTGAQIGTVTALTSTSAAMAINLATNNNFSHTTTENTTLSAPSNPVAGQSGVITITQGGTARTLAYNTFWKFAGGTVPTLTATAGAVDVFAYNVESATRCTAQLIKDVK